MGHTRTGSDELLLMTGGAEDWRATRSPQTRWGRWWEGHPAVLRTIAVLALTWGTVYLAWRLIETGRGVSPAAFYALWLVELYNFVSLAFLAFYGWSWSEPAASPYHPRAQHRRLRRHLQRAPRRGRSDARRVCGSPVSP